MRIPRRSVRNFKESDNEHYIVNTHIEDTVRAINGGIEFGSGAASGAENIMCDFATITFSTAGTEATATHTLGRTPVGVWLIKANMPGSIYNSSAATSANVYLKCDTDNLSGVVVII